MEILSVEPELFRVDRLTEMTQLLVAFRSFTNAPLYEGYVSFN